MKKFFKSLAIASIAMVGMLVSSCQVDDIVTAFEPNAATATILVRVYDQATGYDVTAASQITTSSSGNQVLEDKGYDESKEAHVFELKGNKALSAQTVTVSATYKDDTATDQVDVRAILPGGHAKYMSYVFVAEHPGPTPEVSYSMEFLGREEVETVVGTFSPRNHEGHSHDGSVWAYNETEFMLNVKFNWSSQYGVVEVAPMFTPDMKDDEQIIVQGFLSTIPTYYEEFDEEIEFPISAFSMYTLIGSKTLSVKNYEVVRYETVGETVLPPVTIATVAVYDVMTQVEPQEAAIPGHEGHYHYGHGHDDVHGYSSNAGGGIVWGD